MGTHFHHVYTIMMQVGRMIGIILLLQSPHLSMQHLYVGRGGGQRGTMRFRCAAALLVYDNLGDVGGNFIDLALSLRARDFQACGGPSQDQAARRQNTPIDAVTSALSMNFKQEPEKIFRRDLRIERRTLVGSSAKSRRMRDAA